MFPFLQFVFQEHFLLAIIVIRVSTSLSGSTHTTLHFQTPPMCIKRKAKAYSKVLEWDGKVTIELYKFNSFTQFWSSKRHVETTIFI